MGLYQRVAELKIQTAADRAEALKSELKRLQARDYPSPGSQVLIKFLQTCLQRLDERLTEERALSAAELLSERELEARINRATFIIPFLHEILGFVTGSDRSETPGQLVPALRRYTKTVLANSELIISGRPELNYSIQELSSYLKDVFTPTMFADCCAVLPEYLFLICIPVSENNNALIHAILAHELGHGLYQKRNLADAILSKVPAREDLVKAVLQEMYREIRLPPILELQQQQEITKQVNTRVSRWVEELFCDAVGIYLFGPAFYFAYTHFLLSFSRLDGSSSTHPPFRLRVKFMSRLLTNLYHLEDLGVQIRQSVEMWAKISEEKITSTNFFDMIAIETINTESVADLVSSTANEALGPALAYSSEKYGHDIDKLVPLFLNLIPPGETGTIDKSVPCEAASALNVGWYVYLCNFSEFKKQLPNSASASRLQVLIRLQELVIKTIEIAEISKTWGEVKNAPG